MLDQRGELRGEVRQFGQGAALAQVGVFDVLLDQVVDRRDIAGGFDEAFKVVEGKASRVVRVVAQLARQFGLAEVHVRGQGFEWVSVGIGALADAVQGGGMAIGQAWLKVDGELMPVRGDTGNYCTDSFHYFPLPKLAKKRECKRRLALHLPDKGDDPKLIDCIALTRSTYLPGVVTMNTSEVELLNVVQQVLRHVLLALAAGNRANLKDVGTVLDAAAANGALHPMARQMLSDLAAGANTLRAAGIRRE